MPKVVQAPPPELVSLSDSELLDIINEEMEGLEHELSTNEFALMTLNWKERVARIQHLPYHPQLTDVKQCHHLLTSCFIAAV